MPRGIENHEEVKKEAEVVEEKKVEENVVKTSASEVHWTMPEGKNKVYLYEYDSDGNQITSYTISSYITMKSGHTYVIIAK